MAIGFLQILGIVFIEFVLLSLTDIVVNAGVALVLGGHFGELNKEM